MNSTKKLLIFLLLISLSLQAQTITESNNEIENTEILTSKIQPKESIGSDSSWPWWYWAIGGLIIAGIYISQDNDKSKDKKEDDDPCPAETEDCGSAIFTW